MTDLGKLHYFLGMEVRQCKEGIFIAQKKYAMDLLKKFNLNGCKAVETPMNVNEKLQENDGFGAADVQKFRSLVGGLIYLTHTRPDIMFAVNLVSRFMHKPTKHHYGAVKRVLKYVAGTLAMGIWYCQTKSLKLEGYCDSDWAGSSVDRRSTTGFCFTLGSGAVTWRSKKQSTVALSSCEAEYVAGGAVACEAIWMRKLLLDLGMK